MLKSVTGDIRTKNMFKHSFKNYLSMSQFSIRLN